MSNTEVLSTEVWRLKGATGSTPGMLHLTDGNVRLELLGDDDKVRPVFTVPVASISEVKWPKLQMSGGCSFEVNGEKFRISFLRPQNTRAFSTAAPSAIAGVASISGGRSAGKAWKAALAS